MTLHATRSTHGWNRRTAVALLAAAVGLAMALTHASAALANPLGEVSEFHSGIDEGETEGITLGAEGDLWFTQHAQSDSGEVGRITPEGEVTEFGAGLTGFPAESGITTGGEGNLYFLALSGQGLGEITPTGETSDYPVQGGEPELVAITTDAEGDVWFTQDNAAQIWRKAPGGVPQRFGTGTSWTTPDYDTQGITVGHEGDIWFTEFSAHAVARVDPETGVATQFKTGIPSGAEPTAITTGPEGDLWFTEDASADQLARITPNGNVTQFKTGGSSGTPDGIAAGPEGDLWMTEIENDKIWRVTPGGEATGFLTGDLNNGSDTPLAITAGAEGNMWFTQGESDEIGRIGTGNGSQRPTVVKVEPDAGSAEGGTEVTITGTNLASAKSVSFGSTEALVFTPVSADTIAAIAPPGTAGKTVNVTVSSAAGTSATSHADRFKYLADPLKLGPKSLKPATAGVAYADTLRGSGGVEPYVFEVVSGTLPAGIALSPDGELSGTPEAAGKSTFVVKASDSSIPALTATRAYTLETALDITPASLGHLTAGSPVSANLAVTGGTAPYALSLLGLDTIGLEFSFDAGTDRGLLSGTPTAAGTYTLTAQATDSSNPRDSGTRTFRVKVGLGLRPASLADGEVGEPYESGIQVIGGSGSYSYDVSEGTIPQGLELSSTTGVIGGTPTTAAKSKFTVTVKDLISGLTAKIAYHLKVV
jgi:streptogramin lyase